MNVKLVRRFARASTIIRECISNFATPSHNSLNRTISTSLVRAKIENVKTPNFPESITDGDIRWLKAQGSVVQVDEPIGEIETDKTSLPIVSPYAGVISEFLIPDGSKVTKGDVVCRIDVGVSPPEFKPKPKEAKTKEVANVEKHAHAAATQSTGVHTLKPAAENKPLSRGQLWSPPSERTETRVSMTRIRQTISARLKEAQNTAAMLTTFNEVDMTSAIELRNKYKDRFLKEHGVKLGFMSMFVNASVFALKAQPTVNSVIQNNEILYRNYIDISVAVSSPKGLVVPVIRNAHLMSVLQMEIAVAELAKKAKENSLAIEDMEGGTFTVSNGGVFGSMMSTPIINIPQSAILGMHSIKDRPVAIDGKVEIRPIMYVALTYDHRLIDGREAVAFLKNVKDAIEDPAFIIMSQ